MLIYEGSKYRVRKVFVSDSRGPIVVTFPHAGRPAMGGVSAFGQVFLQGRGIDSYHLLNAEIDWFQDTSFWEAIEAIKGDAPTGRALVTYGASMGGYGALLASRRLDADRVLAVTPQFSIDRAVVPWERRWKAQAERIGQFIHDVSAEISSTARIVSLHDPRSEDEDQLRLFGSFPNWTKFCLPFSGHAPLLLLKQVGLLSEFITAVIEGRANPDASYASLLRSRRRSPMFWRVLAVHAARSRRMIIAENALEKMRDLGASEQEIAITAAAILRVKKSSTITMNRHKLLRHLHKRKESTFSPTTLGSDEV